MKMYICGITFQHELGYIPDIHVYDNLDELKRKHPYYQECGVVEVEVDDPEFWKSFDFENRVKKYNSYKWIVKQDLNWYRSKKDPKAKKESDQ